MSPIRRIFKRITIIFIYITIFLLISTALYYLFRTKPTCTDKIQNQGEVGVDCGGPCSACPEIPKAENLKVIEKAIISSEDGKYDALVKITNPNSQLGVSRLNYSFNILDSAGKIIAKSSGVSFILPGETKYILAFNLSLEEKPEDLDFQISSFEWSEFTEFKSPDIALYAKEFSLAGGGDPGFAKLTARMRNQSGYDFRQIGIYVVIRGSDGSPLAVNKTIFNDVRANEEREINFRWNSQFPVDPITAKIEIVSEVDVFKSENFIKQHGVPGQYGSYNTGDQ